MNNIDKARKIAEDIIIFGTDSERELATTCAVEMARQKDEEYHDAPVYEVAVTHIDWKNSTYDRSRWVYRDYSKAAVQFMEKMKAVREEAPYDDCTFLGNNITIIADGCETHITMETIKPL